MTPPIVWKGFPTATAPLRTIFAARRAGRVVDDAGASVAIGALRTAWEAGRAIVLRLGCHAIGAAATILCRRASPMLRRDEARKDGPVVLVVPVLPDVSHTFVYREALALLRARPDWRCVALAREPQAPLHPEAKELLCMCAFLPRGGVARRLLRLLRWLCSARGRELFSLYQAADGGTFAGLLGKRALADGRDPGNAFELAEMLRAMRPRHIHVYSSTHPANVAMGAAHLLGVPFSISSYVDFEFVYSHKLLAEKFARATFFRVVTRSCEAALNSALGDRRDHGRATMIYLGLDLEGWSERAPLAGEGRVVTAARFVEKKGLRFVPAALRALRDQGIRVRWRLIGDGPERSAVEAAARAEGVMDAIDFLGPLDSAAVRREILGADAAVLPCVLALDGERDGIPVFLNEAMALGVPVVTTPVSGIPEMVVDGETGFLCAPNDSASLALALARALGDRARAARVAAAARALVRKTIDIRMTSAQVIERIES